MEGAVSSRKVEKFETQQNNRMKTWQELKHVVRSVRRKLSHTSTKVPTGFSFRHSREEGLASTRLYFLSALASGRETTLLYADVFHLESAEAVDPVHFSWQPLLESTFQILHPLGRFSREEQLQWERKRLVMWGITSYDYHHLSGRFVFPACGSIFYCDDNDGKAPPFFPQEIKSSKLGARLNPQMCPYNPNLICYIFNSDLWLYNIANSTEVRLTFSKPGEGSLSDEPFSSGIPSYVTQEEFNRYCGFWWQPVQSNSGMYHILYEEVDESEVEILHIPSYSEDRSVEDFRFPRAGTPNSRSNLKMLQFSLSNTGHVEYLNVLQLSESLQSLFPSLEYVVRVGWVFDGQHVWAQLLNRDQSDLKLVLLPLCHFVPSDHMLDLTTSNHVSDNVLVQVIYEEISSVWINVTEVLHFFPTSKRNELTFLWSSEETGFRHLYLITVKLLSEQSVDYSKYIGLTRPEASMEGRVLKKVPLTAGDWEVSEKDVIVDEEKRLVYFVGVKDTPLERHLYVVSLDYPLIIQRLTPLGFSHSISLDMDCSMFVSIQSNITQPPFGQLYLLEHNGSKVTEIKTQLLGYVLEPTGVKTSSPSDPLADVVNNVSPHSSAELEVEIRQPEVFSHQLKSGHLVYGMIFKPVAMEAGRKYPSVLTIYGGPEVQLVTNTFKGMRHLRQHLLAAEGYVVVAVDCRGSRHRGVNFESHIKGRMGTVEIEDQVEVLQWLAENTGYLDLKRIAIHGWSYGGYLSLMGLAQRPDFFKVAIAGAPVTSWNLYDTGYTERYMGTPQNNPHGYSSGSVLSYVNQFPNEENRLFIIHGLKDENVHFTHTSHLISALVKAGKPYDLKIYPTERHSLRHLDSSEHYEVTLLSYLQQHL